MTNTQGIQMLQISVEMLGRTETVHPTLVWNDDHVVLVDTGYPGQHSLLVEAIEGAGIPADRLTHIVITHQDLDHIGGLPSLIAASAKEIEVLTTAVERPYIQGEKRLVKLSPEAIDQAVQALPPAVPDEWKMKFRFTLEHPPQAQVTSIIAGGDELPYGGGLIVVDTPGHTPGHISLYHQPSKTLIAADALIVSDGELHGPIPALCWDPDLALESIANLTRYDIDSIICYHGGLYQGDCNRRLEALASSPKPR